MSNLYWKVKIRIEYYIFLLACMFLCSTNILAQDADSKIGLKEQFMQEAPQKWNEYLRSFPVIKGTSTETTRFSNKKDIHKRQNSFVCIYPGLVFESQADDFSYHYCSNNKYSFSLSTKTGKRILDECMPLNKSSIPNIENWSFPALTRDMKRKSSVNFITEIVAQGLLMDHKWLPHLIHCKNFRIEEIEELFQDNVRLVRIRFTNQHKSLDDEAYLMNVRSGEIFLMPDCFWLIKSGRCSFWSEDNPYTTEWTNVYEYHNFAAPQLVTRKLITKYPKDNESISRDIEYHFQHIEQEKSSMFSLTHYGLPEPDFEKRRFRFLTFRYLLFGIGVCAVLYAVRKKYLKIRHEQQQKVDE